MSAADCCAGPITGPFAALKGVKGDKGDPGGFYEHSVLIPGSFFHNVDPDYIDIVPAQGTGILIIPKLILFEGIYNGTPFTTVGRIGIGYGVTDATSPGDFPSIWNSGPSDELFEGTEDRMDLIAIQSEYAAKGFAPVASAISAQPSSLLNNKAVVLYIYGDEFDTDGDTDVIATTWFIKRTRPTF